MKRNYLWIVLGVVFLCAGAWLLQPSFFSEDNGIILAKSHSTKISALYNTNTQQKIFKNIESMKSKNTYDETSPLMIYNPYGTNTLSLYTYFKTTEKVALSYTVHVNDERYTDFTQTIHSDYTQEHEFNVIGLIPQMGNEITLHVTSADGSTKD